MRTTGARRHRVAGALLTAGLALLAAGCGGESGSDPACAALTPENGTAEASSPLATEACEDTGGGSGGY